ncbi:P-loop containing nucleoside triphosphate hydrolase protein [Xylariaceae sp. FL0255]|nr:P-loop containing nucleoside triphosphate hydrolase protein [Xylariaceae sp. FL0255]
MSGSDPNPSNPKINPRLLIQMSGPPGSGKSTLARRLANHPVIDAVVINHDLIKAFMLSQGGLDFEAASRLTYGLDWVLARDLLNQGRSVIVDTVCNYPEVVENGTALAKEKKEEGRGVVYVYVECRLRDMQILDARLRGRTSLLSQRTGIEEIPKGKGQGNQAEAIIPAVVGSGAALFRKWMDPVRPDGDHAENIIVVDATRSPDECLETVARAIESLIRV